MVNESPRRVTGCGPADLPSSRSCKATPWMAAEVAMGAPRLKLLVAELVSEKRIRSVMVRAQRFFDRNLRAIRSARLASIA